MLKDVVSDNFMDKYFYCLWWGLQQLRYVYLSTYLGGCINALLYVTRYER